MGVNKGVEGKVVVDDVGDVRKIEPASGDVSCDHKADLLLAEAPEDRGAPVLVEPAVDNIARVDFALQVAVEVGSFVARVAEDDGLLNVAVFDIIDQIFEAVAADVHKGVYERLRSLLVAVELDALGLLEILLGQPLDLLGHRRRKQQGLVLLHHAFHDKVNVFDKTHFEHFVSFVQDDGFDVRQIEAVVPDEVDQAAGRGNENMYAVFDFCFLDVHVKTAVDREGHGLGVLGDFVDFLHVLQG